MQLTMTITIDGVKHQRFNAEGHRRTPPGCADGPPMRPGKPHCGSERYLRVHLNERVTARRVLGAFGTGNTHCAVVVSWICRIRFPNQSATLCLPIQCCGRSPIASTRYFRRLSQVNSSMRSHRLAWLRMKRICILYCLTAIAQESAILQGIDSDDEENGGRTRLAADSGRILDGRELIAPASVWRNCPSS